MRSLLLLSIMALAGASHPKTAEEAQRAMQYHMDTHREKVAHHYEKDLKKGMTPEEADAHQLAKYMKKFDHEAKSVGKHLPAGEKAAYETWLAKKRAEYENAIKTNPENYYYITVITTTTITPWDSSSGSSGTASDSLVLDSLNTGSSASDPSGSGGSIGSQASGSSGSYMPSYMWFILAAVLGLCLFAAVATQKGGKAKKKKKVVENKPPAPAPAQEPLPEVAPLLVPEIAVPAIVPATTSYAYPTTTAYATPATTAYAAPATTAYAAPAAYYPAAYPSSVV